MRLTHLVAAGVGLLTLAADPVMAQLRASRPPPQQPNLPRLLVANPHSFSSQDSTASVRVGQGMRERITDIADHWFRTIPRTQMNEALQQYAYPIDAVLPPMVAKQLANQLGPARAMVISTILRGEGGRYTVEARLTGINDDAGQMVKLSQTPNESFEDFGKRLADALSPAFHALPDAKQCENLRLSDPAKAQDAAQKAIRTLPNSGLAHYCQARIAIEKKAPVDTVIAHLKVATQGDPLSLYAWTALAAAYQTKKDSTATIETFKQMLRVAPTNEPLRKDAFGLFQRYGRPDAAEEVADEGIKLDPVNADMWDLKFGACIAQERPEKNRCAIEALEQVFALDTTKADTTFFTKITYAASRPVRIDTLKVSRDSVVKVSRDSAGLHLTRDSLVAHITRDSIVAGVDSARFLKWTRMGVAKYPANVLLLGQLAEAYSLAGPVDSAVAVTKRLMAADSSDVAPVLRVTQKLAEAKRGRDALALAPYIERLGNAEDKQNLASILVRAAFPVLQVPDYPLAVDMAREVIKLSAPNSQTIVFADYVLGVALFQQMVAIDNQAVQSKTLSCPIGQQLKSMLAEVGPALTAGRSVSEAFVAPRLQSLVQFGKHIDSIIKQYCK